ncbi:hypothetical protein [Bacillus sp. FJAT-44742]|uniref:hypothetical protein n=1 Tax=Bacillus sp. FJAT-44742 TaxID=2014005 RepID=UPI000C2381CB|nr:hypothetical protein [Bacillus sp. FJAT-44742]
METRKVIIALLISGTFFVCGLITGKFIYEEPSREIVAGYEKNEQNNHLTFTSVTNDLEDRWAVDNLQQIYMHSNQIEYERDGQTPADVHVWLKNPQSSTILIRSKIWFNDEGAIIKMGESDYREINHLDAAKMKEMIDYNG